MERLEFSDESNYDSLEAAIHLTRYCLVKEIVGGKRVLDAACGEGYGSHLMKSWGAESVTGVDIDKDAIKNAKINFPSVENFLVAPAEEIESIVENDKYDLIVSLETIEHLDDPIRFLKAIKNLVAKDGLIVISCPNDWWYYPSDSVSNPYHKKKYTLEEFKAMTQAILGDANQWILGCPTLGFMNVVDGRINKADSRANQRVMLRYDEVRSALVAPTEENKSVSHSDASYFVGVWGGELSEGNTVGLTTNSYGMSIFNDGILSNVVKCNDAILYQKVHESEQEKADLLNIIQKKQVEHDAVCADLANKISNLEKMARDASLRAIAFKHENELMERNVRSLQCKLSEYGDYSSDQVSLNVQNAQLQKKIDELNELVDKLYLPAKRYLKISKLVPPFFKKIIMKIYKGN